MNRTPTAGDRARSSFANLSSIALAKEEARSDKSAKKTRCFCFLLRETRNAERQTLLALAQSCPELRHPFVEEV
jgi:hypothetical protein